MVPGPCKPMAPSASCWALSWSPRPCGPSWRPPWMRSAPWTRGRFQRVPGWNGKIGNFPGKNEETGWFMVKQQNLMIVVHMRMAAEGGRVGCLPRKNTEWAQLFHGLECWQSHPQSDSTEIAGKALAASFSDCIFFGHIETTVDIWLLQTCCFQEWNDNHIFITLSFSMFFQDVLWFPPQNRQFSRSPIALPRPWSKHNAGLGPTHRQHANPGHVFGGPCGGSAIHPAAGRLGWVMEVSSQWSPWWFFWCPPRYLIYDIYDIYIYMIYVISGMHLDLIHFFGFPMNFPDHIPWYDHCVNIVSLLYTSVIPPSLHSIPMISH